MRPNIDSHDYDVKMRSVQRFFEEGDKVKLTLRFRGREMAHHGTRHAASEQGPRGRSRRSPRSKPSRSSRAAR